MQEVIEHLDAALKKLTDFQRATVQVVCARLQSARGSDRRILVADEVGLGKTVIARGVVATLLKQRLANGHDAAPLRIGYICSNQALAIENRRKLAVFSDGVSSRWVRNLSFDRLAELGVQTKPAARQEDQSDETVLEQFSLTPATSFGLTQGHGNAIERYIVWSAVARDAHCTIPGAELKAFFRADVGAVWDDAEVRYGQQPLELKALGDFHTQLRQPPQLGEQQRASAGRLGLDLRSWRTMLSSLLALGDNPDGKSLSYFLRSRLRRIYVECCAQNLRADLFILDEFQRFKDLVAIGQAEQEPTERQIIAREVLHRESAALLLSATPFKALSPSGDDNDGSTHAQEFGEVLRYLCARDETVIRTFHQKRKALLSAVLSLPPAPLPSAGLDDTAKRELQSLLRRLICRTERAGLLEEAEHALHDVKLDLPAPLPDEISAYRELDDLARAVRSAVHGNTGTDVMAFFKAAPWCLSFLGGYQLRDHLLRWRRDPNNQAAKLLKTLNHCWIPQEKFNSYQIDLATSAPSARFRQLLKIAAPTGAEQLLWLPPSLPYYEGEGAFAVAALQGLSKTLLFSSLVLAPRAISSYVSYDCERRLVRQRRGRRARKDYFTAHDERKGAFRLEEKGLSTAWGLIYPGHCLSALSLDAATTLADLREHVKSRLFAAYEAMTQIAAAPGRQQQKRWYALAPFLLDRMATDESVRRRPQAWLASVSKSNLSDGRKAQLELIRQALDAPALELGQPPGDLLEYLADLAIAGPGVVAWRTLQRLWPDTGSPRLLACSAAIGHALIHKFNRAESQLVLRAACPGRNAACTRVAAYAAMGNLQAVLDEYFHLLRGDSTPEQAVAAFEMAAGTGTVSVLAQTRLPLRDTSTAADVRFHCHYAVPLGNQRGTDEKGVARISNLRAAFNSPFWPFMLNSTSIGQEGLDFHWYCRRVVHWSLPSNPIDVEQREGRVNRYKSLVVRQRAAECYNGTRWSSGDVWSAVFAAASTADTDAGGLVPYWHVPGGSVRMERVIPLMPFSRELRRRHELLRILSIYRLSFGQPRQQELIEELLRRDYSYRDLAEIRRALLLELAPLKYFLCDDATT